MAMPLCVQARFRLCRMARYFFLSERDCSAIPRTFAFALLRRSIAHVPALPYVKSFPHASMRKLLPHGRAFGQKKEAFGWKASKNYIYQNKRGDNFYKIIIPRSCFKQITKLLNFYEFKKLFLLVCNAVCIGKRELYSTGFHCLCLF